MPFFIGVDIGGTFTDCVAVDEAGRIYFSKTLSTKKDPSEGVLTGVELLAEEVGLTLEDLLSQADRLSHGTTIGTNLVVERKGAKVGFITTAGHGDALLMMRGMGRVAGLTAEQVYSVHTTDKPEPIVPQQRIAEVQERVDANGAVVVPLDEEKARATITHLIENMDADAVAISLLWSFKNPVNEQRVAELVRELAPDLFVSVSSEVAPRLGEYERAVATVINGYVGPASTKYLDRCDERLSSSGLERPFLVMQSNGGVVPAKVAKGAPFKTIDSGPTGGLVGTAALANAYGHENVIATDMGGTSFDVGLVVDGEPLIAGERVIEKYTYQLPHIDVRSIACGGGSIARYDTHTRSIRVGPDSAGSEPGPACYGRGGTDVTVTDADVVLGLVRPEAFLGGRMPLDREASLAAVTALGEKVGLSPEETAAGILRINNNNAATLVRQQTLERGYDTRDFRIYAFGGAGPVHAFGYAPELGVSEVVVPLGNGASTLSAYGIASSDIVQYFELEQQLHAPFDRESLASALENAENNAREALRELGFAEHEIVLERTALMRYAEQFMQSLPVRIPAGPIEEGTGPKLQELFDYEYGRQFGEGARVVFQTVEIFAFRVRAMVELGFSRSVSEEEPTATVPSEALIESRDVYWPTTMAAAETAIYDGTQLRNGNELAGPCIVELPLTSVAVAPGQTLTKDAMGSLVLHV